MSLLAEAEHELRAMLEFHIDELSDDELRTMLTSVSFPLVWSAPPVLRTCSSLIG